MNISRGEKAATHDRFNRLPHDHAVHSYIRTSRQILGSKLVFCGDVLLQRVDLTSKRNLIAFSQIGQRDQHVVFRIEFENLIRHNNELTFFPFASIRRDKAIFPRAL